jgi:hypothetical protein
VVPLRSLRYARVDYSYNGVRTTAVSYAAVLDVYDLEEILELNDITNEEALDFLVTQGFIELPRIKPLDFE